MVCRLEKGALANRLNGPLRAAEDRLLSLFLKLVILFLRSLTLGSILLFGEVVLAETASIGSLPIKPGKAGFTMAVEAEVVGGHGYQPIYLSFSPLGRQFVADRYLQIQIGPRDYYGTGLDFDLHYAVKLPQGTTVNRFPLYVPHYYPWNELAFRIYEDGRLIESSDVTLRLSGLRSRYAKQNTSVGIVVPRDDVKQDAAWKKFPDVRTLVTVLGGGPIAEDVNVVRLSHAKAKQKATEVQPAWVQFRLIEENALHEQWLGYSQLDVIIVAEPVLSRIEQQLPGQFSALKDWLAAGGNLWVYAAAESTSSLLDASSLGVPAVNRMVSAKETVNLLDLSAVNDTSDLTFEAWSGVQKESQQYAYRTKSIRLSGRQLIYDRLKAAQHPMVGTRPAAEVAKQIRWGSFGAGDITVIQSDDPFPGSFQFWQSVVNLHTEPQLQWVQRNGIDIPAGNDNYWMWLIESVGQPPVKSFVFLNTLFVIVVGPLCYLLFRRRGRLYLLYFFAPFLATIVTVGLFAYALAADGIKTQTRIRQITWLDLHNGYAVEQSRQTYYAVFGGGGGIKFADDSAIYPVRNTPAQDRYRRHRSNSARRGQIVIDADSQRFSGSFLPPRNQVQYLVTQPREMDAPLLFEFAAGTVKVTNRLSYAMDRLLVRDVNSGFWGTKNVAAGATVTLEPASPIDLTDLLDDSVLPPLGEVPMLNNNRGWGRGIKTGMQVSMLEGKLQRWSQNLPPRSFVATAELGDEQLGVKDAVVIDSVHVLMGEIP